jgi:geranylgeranyl diphosphate synthase type I
MSTTTADHRPQTEALLAGVDAFLAGFAARHLDPASVPHSIAPLQTELRDYLQRPGKRIRPLVFLLACRAFDPGRTPAWGEFSVACALELFHDFVLIHDDIIDRTDARRGLPSLHRAYESRIGVHPDRPRIGRHLAMVMGDVLFALSQKCVLESRLPERADLLERILSYVVDTGLGEALDVVVGTRDLSKVDLPEIEQMYHLKTTRYTVECPLVLAGMLAGLDEAQLDAVASAAAPAGLAFQIENDLREWEQFEISDSSVPSDLAEGKKTALLRTAFARLGETDRTLLQLTLSVSPPTDATLTMLKDLVGSSGAVTALRARMAELFSESLERAAAPVLPPHVREGLASILREVGAIIAAPRPS